MIKGLNKCRRCGAELIYSKKANQQMVVRCSRCSWHRVVDPDFTWKVIQEGRDEV
jgi:DNA-directed RNA polymerase subunit RPC12/RpoP